ncbi:hypothetical protein FQZ97_656230 [compost metagenome]
MTVATGCNGCYNRDHFRAGQKIEKRAVNFCWFTNEAKIKHFFDVGIRIDNRLVRLARENHVTVFAAETDGPFAFGIDKGDDFLVDGTGENHFHHFNRLLVGDAKTAFKARFDAELRQHCLNLWPTAMHDDRVDA